MPATVDGPFMVDMPLPKLWRNRPEVLASSVLTNMTKHEIARQDAMYEVLTTELSYIKQVESLLSVRPHGLQPPVVFVASYTLLACMQIFLQPLHVACKIRRADVEAAKRSADEASNLIKPEFVDELMQVRAGGGLWHLAVLTVLCPVGPSAGEDKPEARRGP